jgi:hypothetical protein
MDLSFHLAAAQADRGRLEIDLLGERGTRPVRLAPVSLQFIEAKPDAKAIVSS